MTLGLGRRARNLAELRTNMEALETSVKHINYQPLAAQPGDVFISSWAKSGTTMMQQMFHQLRMGAATGAGDMAFDDISRVVPWDDTASMIDFDMMAPQRALPRGFKSHRDYDRLPADMRYVVTLRDPMETYVSFYRFYDGWLLERGALPIEEFFPLWMSGGPGGCDYFTHLLSWWGRLNEPDTLLATYKWAARNRRQVIARLAEFLEIDLTDALASLVEEHTSREFMHAHYDRFNDAMICGAMEQRLGIPAEADSTKVQAVPSKAAETPSAIVEQIEVLWAERVKPVTGHANFAALAEDIDARA